MRLFPRTLIIVALTLILLILFINTVVLGVVGHQLNRLEETNITQSMERIDSLIVRASEVQLAELKDNAHWDDIYNYVQHPTDGFIAAYFVSGTFHYMNLNYVLLFGLNGTMVDGGAYDFNTMALTDVPSDLTDYVRDNPYLLQFDGLDDSHQVISRIGDRVVMLGTCPVLTTEETGPTMGSLLMGRVFDDTEIIDLAKDGDVVLEAVEAFDPDMPSDYLTALADPALLGSNRSFQVDSDTITMFAPLRDSNGSLVMLMKITTDRAIYTQGMATFQYVNLTVILVLVADGSILLFLLTRYVIKPVSSLNKEMRNIGGSGDLSARVAPLGHDDEIAQLSGAFNEMMGQLELKDRGLKESEQRYRDLVETSTDWIWQTDPNWRIKYSNAIAIDQLGIGPDELRKMSLFDLMEGAERSEIEMRFAGMKDERAPIRSLVLNIRTKDGRKLLYEMNAQPIFDESGTWQGYYGMARDITERVRNEEALEKSNKQLTLLSSITRHDILNQATILSGYAELLREKIDDPELVQHLDKQQKAIDTVARQIKFTAIYQQLGTQEPIWHDVKKIIESALRQLDMREMDVVIDVMAVEVLADPILERAFYNLFDNVLRHSGADRLNISTLVQGEDLLILFQDNGKGVLADRKERIFSRGFGQNSGLGLFLVREVLDATDIKIVENGTPGAGARFEIRVGAGHWRRS